MVPVLGGQLNNVLKDGLRSVTFQQPTSRAPQPSCLSGAGDSCTRPRRTRRTEII